MNVICFNNDARHFNPKRFKFGQLYLNSGKHQDTSTLTAPIEDIVSWYRTVLSIVD